MSDLEDSTSNVRLLRRRESGEGGADTVRLPAESPFSSAAPSQKTLPVVAFNRLELSEILRLYGRKVAAGEWRDYAMDFTPQRAVFSVYRRTSEVPLYRIEKDPALSRKQGAYSVVAATGMILRRGNDLARVISVLEKTVRLVAT
jgi:hypothetical protein